MFVSEYRTLLADRLLQSLNYDTSREVVGVMSMSICHVTGHVMIT